MSNEQREQQMMADAEAYAAEIYKDEPDNYHTDEQLCGAINDFCAGWRAADQHPQWISVDKELPKEKGKLFLVCDKYGRVCESAYDVEDDIWYRQSGVVLNPTHWMPLPAAPRKEDKI